MIVTTLFGAANVIASVAGSELMLELLQSLGFDYAYDVLKEKLPTLRKPAAQLNHDVQKAMLRAVKNALDELASLHRKEETKNKPWLHNLQATNQQQAVEQFLKQLYKDVEARFAQHKDTTFALNQTKDYLYTDSPGSLAQLTAELSVDMAEVAAHCGEPFAVLFQSQLLSQVRFFFQEELKTDAKAKTAFELDLWKDLRGDVQTLLTNQAQQGEDLSVLRRLLPEVDGRIERLNELVVAGMRTLNRKADETGKDVKEVKEAVSRLQEMAQGQQLTKVEDYQRIENQLLLLDEQYAEAQEELSALEAAGLAKMADKKQVELLQIDQQRGRLQEEKTQFLAFAQQVAQNVLNLPDNRVTRQIRTLIEQGKYREADALMNPEKMRRVKASLQQYNQEMANFYLLKAQLMANPVTQQEKPNWFEEANQYYQDALDLWKDYDNLFAYARFLQNHNQFKEAIRCYEECLPLPLTETQRANLLNGLGLAQKDQNDHAASLTSFTKALSISRLLALPIPLV